MAVPFTPVNPIVQWPRAHADRKAVLISSGQKRMIPALPYENWCNAAGDLIRLAISTTRDVHGKDVPVIPRQQYAMRTRNMTLNAGGFPWEYEDAKRISPALTYGKSEADWIAYREAQQAERQARQKLKSDQAEMASADFKKRAAAKEGAKESMTSIMAEVFANLAAFQADDSAKVNALASEVAALKDAAAKDVADLSKPKK